MMIHKFVVSVLAALIALNSLPAYPQEMLWCSGSRASSPLCVEFNDAISKRSEAKGLKDQLFEVRNPPWDTAAFSDALTQYESAKSQFQDEYFGRSAIGFAGAILLFQNLEAVFRDAVEGNLATVDRVRVEQDFDAASRSAQQLQDWGVDDYSSELEMIESFRRDLEKVGIVGGYVNERRLKAAESTLASMETELYASEMSAYKLTIAKFRRADNFLELVGRGYRELDAGNLVDAKRLFLQAQRMDRNSITVNGALQNIDQQELDQKIRNFKTKIADSLLDEDYIAAIEAYEALGAIDSIFSGEETLKKLQTLVNIERKVDNLNVQLSSLSSVRLRIAIEELLSEMSQNPKSFYGERIYRKYGALNEKYERLNIKVALSITSDKDASVILKPGGRLGTFANMELRVYPGNYTVSARCIGRKEQVKEIYLAAGSVDNSVDIRCRTNY